LHHRPTGKGNKPVNPPFDLRGITEKSVKQKPAAEHFYVAEAMAEAGRASRIAN
jgi:hypothetical protein